MTSTSICSISNLDLDVTFLNGFIAADKHPKPSCGKQCQQLKEDSKKDDYSKQGDRQPVPPVPTNMQRESIIIVVTQCSPSIQIRKAHDVRCLKSLKASNQGMSLGSLDEMMYVTYIQSVNVVMCQ